MRLQVKAFTLLFTVLLAVDALAWHGEYRMRVGSGFAYVLNSVHGLGPGRDWSSPKPQRND